MKFILSSLIFLGIILNLQSQGHQTHEMQHGFILAENNKNASHLVATGHHSRQVEIVGKLTIANSNEDKFYNERRMIGKNVSYFLFQAQVLDLPTLKAGQILKGHIIESQIGKYESKNTIVKNAEFLVEEVILNLENPFFGDE